MIKALFLCCLLVSIAVLCTLVYAPPTPHSMAGFIFTSGKRQVPFNTPFSVNDTNSSDFIRSRTSVPAAALSGRYFVVINGTDNDTILMYAWNITYYGKTTSKLKPDEDNVNATINLLRSPELNITVTFPAQNASLETDLFYNVSASAKVLGADGVSCNLTLGFSDTGPFNISPSDSVTHGLGNPSRGSTLSTKWNITADSVGNSSLVITGRCANENLKLEANQFVSLSGIQAKDKTPPRVRLKSPANNTALFRSKTVVFYYNVTDASAIKNCTLNINKKINMTNSTRIVRNTRLNFTLSLNNGRYNWSVNCTDIYGNVGFSGNFNLTMKVHPPLFTRLAIDDPIDLVSGGLINVTCNATIFDEISAGNILLVNATFFDFSQAKSTSSDDRNNHYHNHNCSKIANSSNYLNVSCKFELFYYANSGTWICNLTAFSTDNLTNRSSVSTTVDELFAVGADPFLDFGNLGPSSVSTDSNLSLVNLGNKDILVSLEGYGKVLADNLSMRCPKGNISVGYEHYSVSYQTPFSSMTNLTSAPVLVEGFVLSRRTNDYIYTNDTNKTFWKLAIPYGLKGACNGTVVVGATPT
ncbi:MAG: hypothetical protein V1837_02645 [Candidatus Woesearchaeota archaeon]